jgi:hypothetical protein
MLFLWRKFYVIFNFLLILGWSHYFSRIHGVKTVKLSPLPLFSPCQTHTIFWKKFPLGSYIIGYDMIWDSILYNMITNLYISASFGLFMSYFKSMSLVCWLIFENVLQQSKHQSTTQPANQPTNQPIK